jgi:hypothetical protein
VQFDLGEPHLKWMLGGSMPDRLSATSTEFVRVPVSASGGGAPVDPTPATLQFAFTTATTAPESGWVDGSWDVTEIGGYVAQCNVGPDDGVIALTAGEYWVWVQIQYPPESVERCCGSLVVY